MLWEDRTVSSAEKFFRQAIKVAGSWPEINLDGSAASHRGLRLLNEEDLRWKSITARARRYLNIGERDHRAVKLSGNLSLVRIGSDDSGEPTM